MGVTGPAVGVIRRAEAAGTRAAPDDYATSASSESGTIRVLGSLVIRASAHL